jgi:hypothetical protein
MYKENVEVVLILSPEMSTFSLLKLYSFPRKFYYHFQYKRKKMWYIYIMKYYSAMKKNDIMFCAGKGMELEVLVFSGVSQGQKDKYHTFSLTCGI